MAPPILRESTNKRACTIEQYNAGKDLFNVVARGLPRPWPSAIGVSSEKVSSLKGTPKQFRVNDQIFEITTKYGVDQEGISVYWTYRIGHRGHGVDTWTIRCRGNDPRNYKAAALEVQQVLIAAGMPRNDFNVQFTNSRLAYRDESYAIPDDPSLIGTIEDIQPKVLQMVREQLPRTWTSIAYHMRGKMNCEPKEMKPTVVVFCKPNSKLNWSMVEAKIVSTLQSKDHPEIAFHLELLPGQVERATPSFITDIQDYQSVGYCLNLTEQPKNDSSIGINDEEFKTACTLGGWMKLDFSDGRSVDCVLTTYDTVRNGDRHNRALNDYNGVSLDGRLPLSSIKVIYPAPMDLEASKNLIPAIARQENGPPIGEAQALDLLDQLSKRGIGRVALTDSPSTFQRNIAPYFGQQNWGLHLDYKVKEGDFIQSISSYQPGERVTHRGRSTCGHARVGRLKRYIHWGDGEESHEDELFGEPGCVGQSINFAYRGDVGSWVVNQDGELVGILSAIDIWTGSRTRSAFITPIHEIVEDIEKRTGGKISLP
ncbi:uncharacterized protein PAC_06546 [Phialocephala subalpina]|uniref:Uncharacterized protein n=1 Tax=Phialocephala subalpina TaxID=576137 RepID=A0A1L7WV63_9HELO|nr:uncharacterized protein PAC_06546 [Phialocephala subalpina]